MRIDITQDDIDRGVRLNECQCPIALAVKRAYWAQGQGNFIPCVVSCYVFRKEGDKRFPALVLPMEAQEFMWRFDGREFVQPFTFDAWEINEDHG